MQSGSPNPQNRKIRLIVIAAAFVAALAAPATILLAGKNAAPNVSFTTLKGERIALGSLRGKVVLINFWATSCDVCIHEMPQMVKTFNRFKVQGLEMVAVAMNYDPPNYVLNYAQTRNLPFHVAVDAQGNIAKGFGDVQATPTTFLIGRNGKIIQKFQGEPDFDVLNKRLGEALAATS